MISSIRFNSPVRPVSRTQKGEATGATGGFSGAAKSQGAGEASTARPTSAVASLDALMALQTVDDPAGRRARLLQRGEAILDDLDALQLDILAGEVPRGTLTRLLDLVEAERDDAGDSRLDSLLDDIELRARVELAKLERD